MPRPGAASDRRRSSRLLRSRDVEGPVEARDVAQPADLALDVIPALETGEPVVTSDDEAVQAFVALREFGADFGDELAHCVEVDGARLQESTRDLVVRQ